MESRVSAKAEIFEPSTFQRENISAVVVCLNEEQNIERCLKSLKWVDEIVVVDSGSSDRTIQIAQRFTRSIFSIPPTGFGALKQQAIQFATGDWILVIDADEEVSAELAVSICESCRQKQKAKGFRINRQSQFLGKWIWHSGWYPDRIVRLFRRGSGSFTSSLVHEEIIVDGKIADLTGKLLHYGHPTLTIWHQKMDRYTTLAAEELFSRGQKIFIFHLFFKPLAIFIKRYIIKRGFLDGSVGLVLAVCSAVHVYLKYAKLWEKRRRFQADREAI